jgi:hypothetical protein
MRRRVTWIGLGVLAAWIAGPAAQAPPGEPPNAAGTLTEEAGRVSLAYEGHPIVSGAVHAEAGATPGIDRRMVTVESNGAVTQVIKWTAIGQGPLTLDVTVSGSRDALAVEVDRPPRTPPVVRTSIGPSHNLRNRAVYDRRRD